MMPNEKKTPSNKMQGIAAEEEGEREVKRARVVYCVGKSEGENC